MGIRTLPDEKRIEVKTKDGIYRTNYLNGKRKYDYSAVKVNKVVSIEPNELFEIDIPEELLGTSKVMVNCMKGKEQWFLPQLRRVHNGKINVRNEMNEIVKVKGVFGEIWTCREVNLKEVRDLDKDETERFSRKDRKIIDKVENDCEDGFKYYDFVHF